MTKFNFLKDAKKNLIQSIKSIHTIDSLKLGSLFLKIKIIDKISHLPVFKKERESIDFNSAHY